MNTRNPTPLSALAPPAPPAPPVSRSAVFISPTSRHTVTPFDSTPDTYTLDGVVYQYVGTSDGAAFYMTDEQIDKAGYALASPRYLDSFVTCNGLGPWCEQCGDCLVCYGEDVCTVTGEPHSCP